MTPAPSPHPSAPIQAALRRALDNDWLDAADLRLVEMLVARTGAGEPDADTLALVIAALCRACAEGSLCLPLQKGELGGALRDLPPATGTAGGDPSESAAEIVPAEAHAARFLSDLAAGRIDAICIQGNPRGGARREREARPLIAAHGNLYFHRHWHALNEISAALRARVDAASNDNDDGGHINDARIREVLRETLTQNPLRRSGPEGTILELAQRQKWALVAALREKVFVLSGGPGTGKTTWTASWLRALLRLPGVKPDQVRLCAPTGRAAQRLQESLRAGLESVTPAGAAGPDAEARDLPVTTLHTLLGYQPYSGRYARGPEDPLDADWVLVDEASMVDVFLLAALTRALKPGARLLLVGDAEQLPPVDAGSVLGELLPDDRLPRLSRNTRDLVASIFPGDSGALPVAVNGVPSVMLDFSHRASGDVVPLAEALRAGDADAVLGLLGRAVSSEHAEESFKIPEPLARIAPTGTEHGTAALSMTLSAFAEAAYLQRREDGKTYTQWLAAFRVAHREDEIGIVKELWKFVAAARVLAPLRHGACSAGNANRILRARLEPLWGNRGDTPGQGFHGAAVLITRNDRSTGLSNGEIGLWLEAASGPVVFFPRPEPVGWLRLPVPQLPAHEPGFAVTVHKSQGSEYDEVLVILPEAGNRLLARETLYTAVTRARARVRIFGTEEAVREAVDKTLRRRGGLRELMGPE